MTTTRRLRLHARKDPVLERGMADIQRELGLPDGFPADVEQTAATARTRPAAASPTSPAQRSRALPPRETPTASKGRPGLSAAKRCSIQSTSAKSPEW